LPDNTLFLIPDISGFTQFVTQTETNHGQHIISELLELLIDANDIGLTLSEIEGDAVFFYTQDIPTKPQLLGMVQSMFIRFHQHLKTYDKNRICQCGACQSAGRLTLKVIAHVGPSNFISVKGQKKPYGQSVILTHRLLKNNVDSQEYLLLSKSYMDLEPKVVPTEAFSWLDLKAGSIDYDTIGTVDYCYSSLSALHQQVPEPEIPKSMIRSRPIELDTYIEMPRDQVFEIIIDLNQRMKWNNFANKLEYDDREINQVGTKHVCVFDSNTMEFESVKADFGDDKLVYGEKIIDLPSFAKDITFYFLVGSENSGCRVQQQIHYQLKPWASILLDPLFRYKNQKINKQVLQHLKEYCESQPKV
jgi:hypothetical protein